MALLSRDAILSAPDRKFVEVEVPEWGGTVRLASMTAGQVLAYYDAAKAGDGRHVGWLLAATIVDDKGEPIFTADDVPALQAKSPAAVLRIFSEASKLNSLAPQSFEEQRGN